MQGTFRKQILSSTSVWMLHYIGAFMWKTDVSLFLSRLAGTVVWRESHPFLFCLLLQLASFSFKPDHFFPSLMHLSSKHLYPLLIFPLFHISFSIDLPLTVSPSLILFPSPFSLLPSLPPSGGHALGCSLLHKKTSAHYLLPIPQVIMKAAFLTLQ